MVWLFAAKRRLSSLLQPLGDCLRCFLLLRSLWIFAQVVGFYLNDCIKYSIALVGPPCPSRLLPKFSAQKEHESWSFQSIPLLINSINLKRDGVGICLGKDVGKWSIEGFLSPPSFRYRVNYIGHLNSNIARSSGAARSSEGLVNLTWVVLHYKSPHWS